ncbi:transcriptional regulator [Streptomyces sp. NBC_01387]|nr:MULTISPECIES: transcriptional regulator [unclassified Streptomyces]WSC24712.1 transcriptional regulator [Streptomyces sp. NBC_01766]WSV58687.1 transcriptional regulator [Streptomyces sp. NBC_01014]
MGADDGPTPDDRPALDETIHHPTRLAVAAFLSACDEAEFAAVRDGCQVSDSVLSKTSSALEAAGYLTARKGYVGKRPRTWLSLTPAGRHALDGHIAALQNIAVAAREVGARGQAERAGQARQ